MNVKEDNYRKRIHLGQDGNALVRLLILNAVVFVILQFIRLVFIAGNLNIETYYSRIYDWFVLPANPEKLAWRPWTLISFMFTDQTLFRFISNMFWLWSFGYILQDLTGNRKIVAIYLYGGIAGAILFMAGHFIFPSMHGRIDVDTLSAANCSIAAIAVATTVISPDYRIFPMISGGIPLWILSVIFLMLNFASVGGGDWATYLAYTGAAGIGYLFIFQMHRGRDGSVWLNQFFDWSKDLFNPDKKKNHSQGKDEYYYEVGTTQPYKKIPIITQKRIDEILDKINQQGYRFLTTEEKDILKRAAEEEDF